MSGIVDIELASLTAGDLLTKRKRLKRRLAARESLQAVRIAVLGGSTTNEVVDLLELCLLDAGFRPEFYQGDFGRFHAEAVHDTAALEAFRPDVVYVHSSVKDIQCFAAVDASETEFAAAVRSEVRRFEQIWTSLGERLRCTIVQNNFEFPEQATLGNLDSTLAGGRTRFVIELNREFAAAARANASLVVQDVCSLSARLGLERWFDPQRWFHYKLATTAEGSLALACSMASIVRALYGRARKVLVLDLDHTLWGGVIGDEGVEGLRIGRETPLGEAYTAFQMYCLGLRARGVLLAVCSKNDDEVARQGFDHPDSVLRLEHFASFKANWEPKSENIAAIARELNLGADSFVFVDDNPAEREIVRAQVQGIAVPEVGGDVAAYPAIIEAGRYFEPVSLSAEDVARARLYGTNDRRAEFEAKFSDYGEYLDSLDMTAEIERFKPMYLERIAQLTNKTNQFNLTGRRYSLAEMESVLDDPDAIGLYGRLSDRFADNGLISIVLGRRVGRVIEIELWLMSCRVLKREMEYAMLDALVEEARDMGAETLRGSYVATRKNGMVADHYLRMGFEPCDHCTYTLEIAGYVPRNEHIRVLELVAG